MIKKNNITFLHITIHLVVTKLNPKDNGAIHFFKDFYKNKNATSQKRSLYALILVT